MAKCCVSSRPHLPFQDAFQGCPGLCLEDLTYPDIERYVTDKLEMDKRMKRLALLEPTATAGLIDDIVSSANGVFLWVRLVAASLLKGLGNHDQISDLQARLNALPRDLGNLFELMIWRVDESYQAEASRFFQLVAAVVEERADNWDDMVFLPTLLAFVFAEEKNTKLALEAGIPFSTQEEVMSRCINMKDRITSRCGGLLEVQQEQEDGVMVPFRKVGYMHRTVKDFLDQESIRRILRDQTGHGTSSQFNANLTLLKSYLLQMKASPNLACDWNDKYCQALFWPAMTYARRVDSDSEFCPVKLLDEVYNTGRVLVETQVLENDSAAYAWKRHPAHTFAVLCGMSEYLVAKIAQENAGNGPAPIKDTLIDLALTGHTALVLHGERPVENHVPNPKIIATLLKYGARPEDMPAISSLLSRNTEKHYIAEPKLWVEAIILLVQGGYVIDVKHAMNLEFKYKSCPETWAELKPWMGYRPPKFPEIRTEEEQALEALEPSKFLDREPRPKQSPVSKKALQVFEEQVVCNGYIEPMQERAPEKQALNGQFFRPLAQEKKGRAIHSRRRRKRDACTPQ